MSALVFTCGAQARTALHIRLSKAGSPLLRLNLQDISPVLRSVRVSSFSRRMRSATTTMSSGGGAGAGAVVAAGRTEELARPRGVEVDTAEGTRIFESARREDAPRLVAELVRAGEKVYGVRVLETTLEEIYLEAVGGETT